MVCNKCNHKLPDDSEFCQYCGSKIENISQVDTVEENIEEVIVSDETTETAEIDLPDLGNSTPENAWNTIVKIQTEETVKNLNENKKEKQAKSRFCKFCGGKIDEKTKKCSGCGKQYFKGIKFNKFFATVLTLSLVIITSIILNIVQFVAMNELKDDKEYYQEKNIKQETEISNLKKEKVKMNTELQFYERHAEIVGDDGTNVYHKYGCAKLDTSDGLWIYNSKAAAQRYKKCNLCH